MGKKKPADPVEQWETLKHDIDVYHLRRLNDILHQAEDKEFVRILKDFLPFFKAPLSKTENTNTNDNRMAITIIRDTIDEKYTNPPADPALQPKTGVDGC